MPRSGRNQLEPRHDQCRVVLFFFRLQLVEFEFPCFLSSGLKLRVGSRLPRCLSFENPILSQIVFLLLVCYLLLSLSLQRFVLIGFLFSWHDPRKACKAPALPWHSTVKFHTFRLSIVAPAWDHLLVQRLTPQKS